MSDLTPLVKLLDPLNIICPFCKSKMQENHSKFWTGMNYNIIRIEFRCHGFGHTASLFARNDTEIDNIISYSKENN